MATNKKHLLFLVLTILCASVFAQTASNIKTISERYIKNPSVINVSQLTVKNNIKNSSRTDLKNGKVFFAYNKHEFAIFGMHNGKDILLGYSDNTIVNLDQVPEAFIELCRFYEENIGLLASDENKNIYKSQSTQSIVTPLLGNINWGQGDGWNTYCPFDTDENARTVTGCVATAAGMIMKYYQYPQQPKRFCSYKHPSYGNLSFDFDTVSYDYSKMLDDAPSDETAKLLYDIGRSIYADYSPSNTQANGTRLSESLKLYFGYSTDIKFLFRKDLSLQQWISLLKADLNSGNPIIYSARNILGGGHAFVCDGYDENNFFHFNFGWDGYLNGYFEIGHITPGDNYYSEEGMVCGIRPEQNNKKLEINNFQTYEDKIKITWRDRNTSDTIAEKTYNDTLPKNFNISKTANALRYIFTDTVNLCKFRIKATNYDANATTLSVSVMKEKWGDPDSTNILFTQNITIQPNIAVSWLEIDLSNIRIPANEVFFITLSTNSNVVYAFDKGLFNYNGKWLFTYTDNMNNWQVNAKSYNLISELIAVKKPTPNTSDGQYLIYRRESDKVDAILLDSTPSMDYTDTTPQPYTEYYYSVVHKDENANQSSKSNEICLAITGIKDTLIKIPHSVNRPRIDGTIRYGEWNEAAQTSITIPGYRPARLYCQYSDDSLYFAMRDNNSFMAASYDVVRLYFDTDNNGLWNSRYDNNEGGFELFNYPTSNYNTFIALDNQGEYNRSYKKVNFGSSAIDLKPLDFEIAIGADEYASINFMPGDTMGFYFDRFSEFIKQSTSNYPAEEIYANQHPNPQKFGKLYLNNRYSGRVTFGHIGQPGITVKAIRDIGDSIEVFTSKANDNGLFSFSNLPEDEYTLYAIPAENDTLLVPTYFDWEVEWHKSKKVKIKPDSSNKITEFRMSAKYNNINRGSCSISGRIVNSITSEFASKRVFQKPKVYLLISGLSVDVTEPDEDGFYSFNNLLPSTYSIYIDQFGIQQLGRHTKYFKTDSLAAYGLCYKIYNDSIVPYTDSLLIPKEITLSFTAKHAFADEKLRIDRIQIKNITKNTDTTLFFNHPPGDDPNSIPGIGGTQPLSFDNFPNPFNTQTTLRIYSHISCTAQLEVNTLDGKTVYNNQIQLTEGINYYKLALSGRGVFIATITTQNSTFSTKLVATAIQTQLTGNSQNTFNDSFNSLEEKNTSFRLKTTSATEPTFKCLSADSVQIIAFHGKLVSYTKNCRLTTDTTFTFDLFDFTKGMAGNDTSSFIDERDSTIYRTVRIGNDWWMAENLSYMPKVFKPESLSLDETRYYVYNYNGTNVSEGKATGKYHTYGVLYNYEAAQASCPSGWHLPDDTDWQNLERTIGLSEDEIPLHGYRGDSLSSALKSQFVWDNSNLECNKTGFSALPAGLLTKSGFQENGIVSIYWSSDFWLRYIDTQKPGIYRGATEMKDLGLSVRCVKD